MLSQLSQVLPLCPLHPEPSTCSGNPCIIVHVHGLCISVVSLLYFLCYASYPHDYSVTTSLYFFFLIVVQVQLSPFTPHCFPQPQPSPLPILDPNPLWLCPCVLYTYMFLDNPSPFPPPIIPSHLPCGYCLSDG